MLIFGGAYIRRGFSTEGNLRLKIDWGSLIVGRKFTVFALFYFVLEGIFPISNPQGAYIWRGDLTEGFLRYRFEGLIFGGAYTWRGLFSEFYCIPIKKVASLKVKGSLSVLLCVSHLPQCVLFQFCLLFSICPCLSRAVTPPFHNWIKCPYMSKRLLPSDPRTLSFCFN